MATVREATFDLLPAFKRAVNAGRPYLLDVVVDPEHLK
jgi:thiamine pyrophosphate-dependent acetolactate synthase large subunit-like protein